MDQKRLLREGSLNQGRIPYFPCQKYFRVPSWEVLVRVSQKNQWVFCGRKSKGIQVPSGKARYNKNLHLVFSPEFTLGGLHLSIGLDTAIMKASHPILILLIPFICCVFGQSLLGQNFSNPSTGGRSSNNVNPTPQLPHHSPPLRWEYLIWEVRVGGGAQKLPEYCLHFPNGSSRVFHEWDRAFRSMRVPVIQSSKVDDVNALNSLGLMGWELVTIAIKEDAGRRVLFHYMKRPLMTP